MSDIELVIFDCDGVLVDSEIIGTRIECELLHTAGYEISVERFAARFSGMSWKDILWVIEAETGLSLTDSLLDKTESILDSRLPIEVQAIDGVHAVLETMQYKVCVCSNTKLPRVDAMLTKVGLKERFSSNVFSAKDLGEDRSKPKPDIFLFGAKQMGVIPARAIVVEDSVHGVQAACSAGMRVIGFTGGSHTYSEHARKLKEAGANAIVPHMRDLPAAIAEFSR